MRALSKDVNFLFHHLSSFVLLSIHFKIGIQLACCAKCLCVCVCLGMEGGGVNGQTSHLGVIVKLLAASCYRMLAKIKIKANLAITSKIITHYFDLFTRNVSRSLQECEVKQVRSAGRSKLN